MAKITPSPDNVTHITTAALSPTHRKTLQGLKRSVTDAAKSFGAVREKLTDLAPKIVRLYNGILAEHDGFTFVEFARMFDPSVPTHAADRDGTIGYRNHRVYYTLAYMRRLVQTNTRGRRGQQGVRDSATDALARTLATMLQVVSDPESVWNAIQGEFQFSERLMTRLRKRVEATKPLFQIKTTKPATVGSVIHMEPAAAPAPEADNAAPMAQAGRRVTVKAGGRRPLAKAS